MNRQYTLEQSEQFSRQLNRSLLTNATVGAIRSIAHSLLNHTLLGSVMYSLQCVVRIVYSVQCSVQFVVCSDDSVHCAATQCSNSNRHLNTGQGAG